MFFYENRLTEMTNTVSLHVFSMVIECCTTNMYLTKTMKLNISATAWFFYVHNDLILCIGKLLPKILYIWLSNRLHITNNNVVFTIDYAKCCHGCMNCDKGCHGFMNCGKVCHGCMNCGKGCHGCMKYGKVVMVA